MLYLGCLVGFKLPSFKEVAFLLDKVRKRLNHWSNRMLSMQGHIVLLKHVFREILVFHLMDLTLNKDGFDNLEEIFQNFLWGTGEQGQPKNVLVA